MAVAAQPTTTTNGALKWPAEVVLVRHGESTYNGNKALKNADPTYQRFKHLYDKSREGNGVISRELQLLAGALAERWKPDVPDYDTPLTSTGIEQSRRAGIALAKSMFKPDAIIVSPYRRAYETLRYMTEGWPALEKCESYEEELIREQEHGMLTLYNDLRIYFTLHPQQWRLYERDGPYYYRYPQGESVPDVRMRNRLWLNTLVREFSGQRVLVITHHLTILAMKANLQRLNADQFVTLDKENKPANCSVTMYRGVPGAGRKGQGKIEEVVYNKQYT